MYIVIGGDGKEYGPKAEVEVREWITEGRLNAVSRIKEAGEDEWQALGDLSEFQDESGLGVTTPPLLQAAGRTSNTHQQSSAPTPSYMAQAILVTLCCCMPLGIPAIVFASRVDGLVRMGNYSEAKACSDKAKMWCWIGFGLGIPANIIAIALQFSSAFQNGL